jgi:hypothetical protein
VFQPGGLGRQCRWGSDTAGYGHPASAGGGHWLLAGSEPLPEAVFGSGEAMQNLHGSSQIIRASESVRVRGIGSYADPHIDEAQLTICSRLAGARWV